MNEHYIINIGRQLGSGGKSIAKILSEKFHISFYDKELLDVAAKESGFGKEFFEKADETSSNYHSSNYFGFRMPLLGNGMYDCYLSNDSLFNFQSEAIRHIAEKGSCIFIGRCADYVLRDNPYCVNIFINADKKDCIDRLQIKFPEMNDSQIMNLIEKGNKKRASFYNYYSNKKWGAAETYHLCINSSSLGLEKTADLCEQFIKEKLGI